MSNLERQQTDRSTRGYAMNPTYRGTVYPSHCDHMGHMNVMWYVGKFDEATWQLLATLGLTATRFRREGIGMATVDQHIAYKRELRAGDVITVRSAVLDVTSKSISAVHEIWNDETGEIAATMTTVVVHLDTNIRRARALPSDVRERAARMISSRAGHGVTHLDTWSRRWNVPPPAIRSQTVSHPANRKGGL